MFLVVALYLDVWKILFIRDEKMWAGLRVVPILLFANMFLGIYYNLSIWYRLSRKTTAGAYITLIGAGITIVREFYIYTLFQLYGMRMGHISLLWNHDGHFLYLGTKILSRALCLEKTSCIYGDCGNIVFYSSWHNQYLA